MFSLQCFGFAVLKQTSQWSCRKTQILNLFLPRQYFKKQNNIFYFVFLFSMLSTSSLLSSISNKSPPTYYRSKRTFNFIKSPKSRIVWFCKQFEKWNAAWLPVNLESEYPCYGLHLKKKKINGSWLDLLFSPLVKKVMCHLIGFCLLVNENTSRGAFTHKKLKPWSTVNSWLWLLNNLTLKRLIYVPLDFLVALFSGGLTYGWAYYLTL